MRSCPVCGTTITRKKPSRLPYIAGAALITYGVYGWDQPQKLKVEEIPVEVVKTTIISKRTTQAFGRAGVRRPRPHVLNY